MGGGLDGKHQIISQHQKSHTMPKPEIFVALDFPDIHGALHPVTGRTNLPHGIAVHDPARGCKTIRFPLDRFRQIRHDLFDCKRSGQFPIPDVEIVWPEGSDADTAEKLAAAEQRITDLEAELAVARQVPTVPAEPEVAEPEVAEPEPPAADPVAVEVPNFESSPAEEVQTVTPTDETDGEQSSSEESSEPMTPSEAGKILGNGIPEDQDAEAARVLAEQATEAAPKKRRGGRRKTSE